MGIFLVGACTLCCCIFRLVKQRFGVGDGWKVLNQVMIVFAHCSWEKQLFILKVKFSIVWYITSSGRICIWAHDEKVICGVKIHTQNCESRASKFIKKENIVKMPSKVTNTAHLFFMQTICSFTTRGRNDTKLERMNAADKLHGIEKDETEHQVIPQRNHLTPKKSFTCANKTTNIHLFLLPKVNFVKAKCRGRHTM